jgi:hypothetical protein
VERRKIDEFCPKVELAAGATTVAARTVVTVTMLVAVAVLTEGEVPEVGTELSVTVAVSVCEPATEGTQLIENGEVPPTVPMLTPLSKNWTEAMLAPAVAVAVAVIVKPEDVIKGIVVPEAGDVIEIVGVAWATVTASTAHAAANTRRREKAGGAEIALGTTRSTSEQ